MQCYRRANCSVVHHWLLPVLHGSWCSWPNQHWPLRHSDHGNHPSSSTKRQLRERGMFCWRASASIDQRPWCSLRAKTSFSTRQSRDDSRPLRTPAEAGAPFSIYLMTQPTATSLPPSCINTHAPTWCVSICPSQSYICSAKNFICGLTFGGTVVCFGKIPDPRQIGAPTIAFSYPYWPKPDAGKYFTQLACGVASVLVYVFLRRSWLRLL